MTGLLIFSIYVSFSNEWATHAQAPQQPLFLSCSQCRRWPKVPLELFQKIEALTQGWPFLKALALLQGFGPSSRLSIFSSIAFSGYFNPATLFLFHLRCSLWLRPSFILRPGTFWTAPCLCLVVGKGWTAHCWSCCCFAGSALSQGLFVCPFSRPFACPFPRPFACPFPRPLL